MLMQGYRVGDTLTLICPDGTQAHGKVTAITDRQVRIAWEVPKEIRISRDTIQAKRVYEVGA